MHLVNALDRVVFILPFNESRLFSTWPAVRHLHPYFPHYPTKTNQPARLLVCSGMLLSFFNYMADDPSSSRGRSAWRRPAPKRRLSCNRRFSFNFSSRDTSPSPEGLNHIDYTTSVPSPPLVPTVTTPRPTSGDIFPPLNRTDPFRPPSPPLITPKHRARLYLRTARLALLHQLGPKHPLMTRAKLNGTLKPTAWQPPVASSSAATRLPQPRGANLAYLRRRAEQRPSNVAHELHRDNQHSSAEKVFEHFLARRRRTTTPLVDAYQRHAKKEEVKRRKALKEETESANAQLEKEVRRLSRLFDECAVLCDEIEKEMMFPIDIGVAM